MVDIPALGLTVDLFLKKRGRYTCHNIEQGPSKSRGLADKGCLAENHFQGYKEKGWLKVRVQFLSDLGKILQVFLRISYRD